MNPEKRRSIIEALIFACDVPLTYSRAKNVIGDISPQDFVSDIEAIERFFQESGRPFGVIRVAGGVQFGTNTEYAIWIRRLLKDRLRSRLSPIFPQFRAGGSPGGLA